MNILAIDSASRHRLVCGLVAADGTVIGGETIDNGLVSEALLPVVAHLLASSVGAVVVVDGPGSFTGLRAGMGVALGVAHAIDVPLHGVGALTVVAAAAGMSGRVEAVADAGRGFLYTAVVECHDGRFRMLSGPRRVEAASWKTGPDPAVSFDALPPVAITRHGNPLRALATAAVWAIGEPPRAREGLAPGYVDATSLAEQPRVS